MAMNFEKSLNNLCWEMLLEEPFYGLFLAELNKRFSKRMPTACVGKDSQSINVDLIIGEDFWETTLKNDSQRKFVLQHELLHVCFNHFFFDWMQDKLIRNMAMDTSINQMITKYEGPTEKGFEPQLPSLYPQLNLKLNEGSQYYYDEFMKAYENKQQSALKGQDSKAGPKGNKDGTSGDKRFDQMMDNRDQYGDWHDLWEQITKDMTEGEKKILEEQINSALREVADQIEKQRGTIPAHLQDIIKKVFQHKKPVVEWKQLFKQFIGSAQSADEYRTRKRPNLRFEDSPVTRFNPKVRVALGVDMSGSMGDDDLNEVFGEVYHVWKGGGKVTICSWDTMVHDVYEYKGEKHIKRSCCGGTEMSSFMRWANEHKKDYDVAICFSDGYVEGGIQKCDLPCLILITTNGNKEIDTKHKVLRMNTQR